MQSIDIENSPRVWLYLALLESSDVEERKRVLLEATKEDRDDQHLFGFISPYCLNRKMMCKAEALLKTIELDPFAIIAVDDYVEHLIAKESFEECVDWLCNLYEVVLPSARGGFGLSRTRHSLQTLI